VITELSDEHMEIETAGGVEIFSWSGPSLTTKFAEGTEVAVGFFAAGPGGLGPWRTWTIVRSSDATAASLGAEFWMTLPTTTGAKTGVGVPLDFPSLQYVNAGCCSLLDVPPGHTAMLCSFSSLEAAVGEQAITVEEGTTGSVDQWSITHLHADYVVEAEYIFDVATTLLGPATSADAEAP
jgi:hypothetical protein